MNAIEAAAAYPVSKWILWCGAGISCGAPTKLPLAVDLTTFALDETCGEPTRRRLLDRWHSINKLIATEAMDKPLGVVPRLEVILGEIDELEQMTAARDCAVLIGFEAFAEAPPNTNHILLAHMVRHGALVVTVNFDTCIEDAYRSIFGEALVRDGATRGNRFSDVAGSGGGVWHIHGVADEIRSLGATIRAVKEGLDRTFAAEFEARFDAGALLMFAGYGAGDAFDVAPFFRRLPIAGFPASSAAFLQHEGAEPPESVRHHGAPFVRWGIQTVETTEFLRQLGRCAGVEISVAEGTGAFEWKSKFKSRISIANRQGARDMLICRIANALGLNVSILDPGTLRRACVFASDFDSYAFHKAMAIVHRTRGNARLEKRHDMMALCDERELLGYHFAHGDLAAATRIAISIDDLLSLARDTSGELNWEPYTSLSAHARQYLARWIVVRNTPAVGDEARRVRQLIEVARALGERTPRGVRFVNQLATAMRLEVVLRAVLGDEIDYRTLENAQQLYCESASAAGLAGVHRDVAIAEIIHGRIHGVKSWRKRAWEAAWRSRQLAGCTGDRISERRAWQLLARTAMP